VAGMATSINKITSPCPGANISGLRCRINGGAKWQIHFEPETRSYTDMLRESTRVRVAVRQIYYWRAVECNGLSTRGRQIATNKSVLYYRRPAPSSSTLHRCSHHCTLGFQPGAPGWLYTSRYCLEFMMPCDTQAPNSSEGRRNPLFTISGNTIGKKVTAGETTLF
jgi:hypothetical protein